ncbi:hypothetical protein HHI36_009320 [Cryptolaemus montrouzieri]|uniref:Cytochrome P450 n=1 Tax=Cryptolaemus montrouzieri TaxID=559131 RepID=A0ABD2MVK9_9CUCU
MNYAGENIIFITLLSIVSVTLLVFTLKRCYRSYKNFEKLAKFDGPKVSSFLLGHWDLIAQTPEMLHTTLRQLAKKYYPHYNLRILHHSSVNILSPEDCEIILGTKKHSRKSVIYLLLLNWLNDGLLLSKGEKWTQRRKILTPAFHFSILKNFLAIFNEECEKIIEVINNKSSETMDVVALCSEFALYAINKSAMGHTLDPRDKEQLQYRDAIYSMGDIYIHRLARPWLHNPLLYFLSPTGRQEYKFLRILHNFTRTIIKKRMSTFENITEFEKLLKEKEVEDDEVYLSQKKRKLAMLDILLQAKQDGEQIDYEGICEEVDTFMFEGHDTTAVALSFCLMLIANHPAIQEEIYQEIKSVLENRKTPTYSDLQKMEYLERCIKESLRLYPSVYFISRITDEDAVLHSGLMCPEGTTINIQIFDVHRNPEIYPDPEKFDPDRFLPDNCQNRHPFAYIPFSAGPRNCIGQRFAMLEMKTLLVGILQRFKLIPVDTPETIVIRVELVIRAKNGIKVKFIPRN